MRRWTIHAADHAVLVPIFQVSEPVRGRFSTLRQFDRSLLTLDAPSGSDVEDPLVVFTGSLAETEGGGLFDAHPGTWGARGWAALEDACVRAMNESAREFVIRPHARHVVSDLPGIRRFASVIGARWPGRFRLLLDPASMLDVVHLERQMADDMLRRIAAEIPMLDVPELPLYGLVVANVDRRGESLMLSAIEMGEIDPGLIRSLFVAE